MCGIFGIVGFNKKVKSADIYKLAKHAKQRGKDSSGLILSKGNSVQNLSRANYDITSLLKVANINDSKYILGHSRLITNGLNDNQPVTKQDISVLHNGIITNADELWNDLKLKRQLNIDSEIIAAMFEDCLSKSFTYEETSDFVLKHCKGIVACAVVLNKVGKLILFSNNGSLYCGEKGDFFGFSSEKYGLDILKFKNIKQIKYTPVIIDLPCISSKNIESNLYVENPYNLPTISNFISAESKLLLTNEVKQKRCVKCILPESMPFISFDHNGICNYCNNYQLRNIPKPKSELFNLVENYRREGEELDCIVPFSGGRDSSYALHLIVKELKMKPVTYTYDWGMVTDLGRRNVSRMCSELGVENIIVAADIRKKRHNIRMNLVAWLNHPNLGLLSLLTAGDKHFFRYVEQIKKQTQINLNLWGVNPLEATYFKSGFLGVAPDFEESKVYSNGVLNQLNYHTKRFKAMAGERKFFNSSLFDTLSGEYHRSFTKKKDYFHIYDYWRFDENVVNDTLIGEYGWEKAIDTSTTWRIGDATAAFYNYVTYTVAGFSEHDTFRSNQIREGQITREHAMNLVKQENLPRYQNIKWYLDTLNLDFKDVINKVNKIPKLYQS